MALSHSSSIATNGLVFYYDMNNGAKSWRGAPTTNLASFNVAASGFSTDTSGNLSQTSNSSEQTFQGRLSRKMVILAAGYWNCYIYSYNTGVSSTVFAASCKIKTADGSHPNTFIAGGYIYGSAGSFFPTPTFSLEEDGWYRVSWTYSGSAMTLNSLTGLNGTSPSAKTFFITDYQVEALSFSTPFAGVSGGSRSNTQALLDLTNISTITASSLTYNSNNTFSFNGSNNFLSISSSGIVTDAISVDIWFNVNSAKTYAALLGSNVTEKYEMLIKSASNLEISLAPGNYIQHNNILSINTWVNIVVSASNGVAWKVYKNGVDLGTPPVIAGTYQVSGTGVSSIDQGRIRSDLSSFAFSGNIGSTKIYNRALSAAEVQQNFNAHRGRYGI